MRDHLFTLDRNRSASLQSQLREKLVDAILAGQIPGGAPLPSCRHLAKQLGVARNTVVLAYQQLVEDVPEPYREPFKATLEWAQKHRYVIERFGRFPELNEMLGRESTEDEIEFIKEGKYSFL